MADFVAVLRKTLDGLGETTPELRARVYDKARATVEAKLAALNPPPPKAVADRQRAALEDAIATLEAEHAPPPPPPPAPPVIDDPLAELESVFASLSGSRAGAKTLDPALRVKPQPAPEIEVAPPPAPRVEKRPEPVFDAPAPAPPPAPEPEITAAVPRFEPELEPERDDSLDFLDDQAEPERDDDFTPRRRERSHRGLAVALALLVVAGGAGYGLWLNRDAFSGMLGTGGAEAPPAEAAIQPEPNEPVVPAGEPAAEPPTEIAAAPPAEDEAEPAAAEPPAEAAAPADEDAEAAEEDTAPATPETPKFTQRLQPDGTETDVGPAGEEPLIGEGTTVAALTQPPGGAPDAPAEPEAQPVPPEATAATPEEPAAPPPDAAPATTPATTGAAEGAQPEQLAVGQRAIFYEERTAVAPSSAEPGSIVWTLVQESPGDGQPPEPAIRAEATIPGKNVQLRMTIRRNADKTLPASHIIEMIFLTPQGFEGGGIEDVLRVSFKSNEQETGSPLLGIPAKIADGFFLVALNDTKPEIDANLSLLQRRSWIDVPVVYKSGRRALFTMEKGIPGEKVFTEAIRAWQAAS